MTSCPAPPKYYALAFFYKPILPSANRRYNREATAPNSKCALPNIPANTKTRAFTEEHPAGSLFDGWDEYVHPEGDTYWYQPERGLLTSLDPRDPRINNCLSKAFDDILAQLPSRFDMEIFLDLDFSEPSQPASVTVFYYMVDHRNRQIFWASDVDFNAIGILPCQSKGHLKSLLTPEYWVHVDYFPVHVNFDKNLSEAEAELMAIMGHGAVDDKTAPGSTCPWGAAECIQYLGVLRDFRTFDDKTPYRVATIARLWSAVGRARHINSYGLPNARLDRLQGFVDYTPVQRSITMTLCDSVTFGVSISILQRMSTLFNGRVVYHRHWDIFFHDLRGTWVKTGCIGGLILLCDMALIASELNNVATMASASLSGASIFIALLLHQKHPQWKLATGPDISQYVMSVEDYYQGLRPLSIILALPQTVSIYAALFFHIGLLLVVTDRIRQAQEAMWMMAAMSIGLAPLVASILFFAPPKPESRPGGGSGSWSILRKWKERGGRGRNV
ncbi:hypothetical protein M407DRAFT_27845 [Tulasnella calospora MUT 4182]|uniref:WW domain-containing protein n=1 Tax=Tulasnella calospora MUT 4182 TaxID=1051891 RepID=A0A0C3QBR6_9AGAM|nr:hypothetical protein M407DRAFT_27845 [Tulasnella calospora MUT 4182]